MSNQKDERAAAKEQRANSLIREIHARQILDSSGVPSVEVEVTTGDGVFRSSVPQEGRGDGECSVMRDGDKQYGGRSVQQAIERINVELMHNLVGVSSSDQAGIDSLLQEMDGTPQFEVLGANVAFPISAACCLAGAANSRCPLWKYIAKIADTRKCSIPVPLISVFAGGPEVQTNSLFQDVMVAPVGATSFFDGLKVTVEVISEALKQLNPMRGTAEFGGYQVKSFKNMDEILGVLDQAIHAQGMEGKVSICLQVSARDFAQKQKDQPIRYDIAYKEQIKRPVIAQELCELYVRLITDFPIAALIDPFDPDDKESYQKLRAMLEKNQLKCQIMTSQLTNSQSNLIQKTSEEVPGINGCYVKPSQCGTVTNAINAVKTAFQFNWKVVPSARFGETNDCFLSHFAVGVSTELIRIGGLQRSERLAKYNEIIRIEESGEVVYGCQEWM